MRLNRLHLKLSQQNGWTAVGRTRGTDGTHAGSVIETRRFASTKEIRIAIGLVRWRPSVASSISMGTLGWRDSEQAHSPPSQTRRRSCQSGSSSSIRNRAASVQASATINWASRSASRALAGADTRVQTSVKTLENSDGVSPDAMPSAWTT